MNKTQQAIKYTVFIIMTLAVALFGTVFVFAEFGADWAISIIDWLNQKYGLILGGGTITALFALYRTAVTMTNNTGLSLNKTSKITDLFNGFLGKAEAFFTRFTEGISQLFENLTLLKSLIESVGTLTQNMGGIKKTVDGLGETMKFLYDVSLLQLAKTESDEYISSLKIAAMKPQLIERAAKLRELITDTTIAEAERAEASRVVASAAEQLRVATEETRKEVAIEKKVAKPRYL
jgi:hypothetical protein